MESTNIFIFDALDPLFFSNSVQKERGTCSCQTLSNGNGILEQFPAIKKRKRLCISVVTFYCMDNSLVFI